MHSGRIALLSGVTFYNYYRYWEVFRIGCTVIFITYRDTRRAYLWAFPQCITNGEETEDWVLL